MQISAANLLLAGQQNARPAQAPSPARAVSAASNTATAEFAPLEFARVAGKPPGTSPASMAAQPAAQTFERPGSRLDIRV